MRRAQLLEDHAAPWGASLRFCVRFERCNTLELAASESLGKFVLDVRFPNTSSGVFLERIGMIKLYPSCTIIIIIFLRFISLALRLIRNVVIISEIAKYSIRSLLIEIVPICDDWINRRV